MSEGIQKYMYILDHQRLTESMCGKPKLLYNWLGDFDSAISLHYTQWLGDFYSAISLHNIQWLGDFDSAISLHYTQWLGDFDSAISLHYTDAVAR